MSYEMPTPEELLNIKIESMMESPQLASDILALDESERVALTETQKEALLKKIGEDATMAEEAVLYFEGSSEAPSKTEKWWLDEFKKIINS